MRKWSTKPLVFHTLKGFELQIPTWQSGRPKKKKRMLTIGLYLGINVYLSRGKNDNQ